MSYSKLDIPNILRHVNDFNRLSTDVTVRKLQYRVGTVIRVSTQRRRHNFIVLPPYFYSYTCSCCSSPFPGKALALRTDSNGLSDPANDERSVGIERAEERRRAKFSSSWPDRILSNFGVFAFVKTIYQRVRWNQ